MTISQEEIKTVQEYFPALDLNTDKTKILGEFSFSAYYDGCKLYLDPKGISKKRVFGGCYEIEIKLYDLDPHYGLPKIYESGGKILKYAQENGIQPMDMHLNKDLYGNNHYCCIGIFTDDELKKLTFYSFVIEYIFSFFAWQAYRSKFSNPPPWGEYSHCKQGVFEKKTEVIRETGRNDPCPCGSGRKFKQCCRDNYRILY